MIDNQDPVQHIWKNWVERVNNFIIIVEVTQQPY